MEASPTCETTLETRQKLALKVLKWKSEVRLNLGVIDWWDVDLLALNIALEWLLHYYIFLKLFHLPWSSKKWYTVYNWNTSEKHLIFHLQAFSHTAEYDTIISGYMRENFGTGICRLPLRYGMNPHQKPAQVFVPTGALPFQGNWTFDGACYGGGGCPLISTLSELAVRHGKAEANPKPSASVFPTSFCSFSPSLSLGLHNIWAACGPWELTQLWKTLQKLDLE